MRFKAWLARSKELSLRFEMGKKTKDLLELELLLIGPGKIPGKLHPMLSFNSSFSQISLFFSHFFFFLHVLNVWILKKIEKENKHCGAIEETNTADERFTNSFFPGRCFWRHRCLYPAKATHPVPTTYDIKDTSRLSIPRLLATSSPGSEKRNDVACKSFFTGAVFFVSSVSRPRGRGEARGCQ